MDDIIIYPSTGKMAFLAFGSLAMAVGCGSMVVFQKEMEVPDGVMVVAVLGALMLFGAFFWALFRLFNPTPSVIVNRDGITENASAIGAGLIRWDEIAEVTIYKMNYTTNLGIIVTDPESLFRRLPSGKSSLMRASYKLTQCPISIPQSTLPVSAEDLAQQIIAYRQSLPVASPVSRPAFAQSASPAVAAPLPGFAPSSEPVTTQTPAAVRCAGCGATSQGTKFCPSCGQPMQVKMECGKCGAKLKPTTKFCPDCGAKV